MTIPDPELTLTKKDGLRGTDALARLVELGLLETGVAETLLMHRLLAELTQEKVTAQAEAQAAVEAVIGDATINPIVGWVERVNIGWLQRLGFASLSL